jgi:hypothetical protein
MPASQNADVTSGDENGDEMTIQYETCLPQHGRERIRLRSTDREEIKRAMRLPGCVCGWGTVANGVQHVDEIRYSRSGTKIMSKRAETVYNVMQLVNIACSVHALFAMYPVNVTVMK